jgi:serine/threonine protein phosphatase PrpC
MKSNLNKIASSMLLVVGANLAHAWNVQIVMDVTKDQVREICRNAELKNLKTVNSAELCEVSTDWWDTWKWLSWAALAAAIAGGTYMLRRRKKTTENREEPQPNPTEPIESEDTSSPALDIEPASEPIVTTTKNDAIVPDILIDDLGGVVVTELNASVHTTEDHEFHGKHFEWYVSWGDNSAIVYSRWGLHHMHDYVNTISTKDWEHIMIVLDGVWGGNKSRTPWFVNKIWTMLEKESVWDVIYWDVDGIHDTYWVATTIGRVAIRDNMLSVEKVGDVGIVVFNAEWTIVHQNISWGFIPDDWFGSDEILDSSQAKDIIYKIFSNWFPLKSFDIPPDITTKWMFMEHFGRYTQQFGPENDKIWIITKSSIPISEGDRVLLGTDWLFDNISVEHIKNILMHHSSSRDWSVALLDELDRLSESGKNSFGIKYKEDNIWFALYKHSAKNSVDSTSVVSTELSLKSQQAIYDTYFSYWNWYGFEALISATPNATKYIWAFHDIIEKYGKVNLDKIRAKVRNNFDVHFNKLLSHWDETISSKDAWIYWDIAKQYYLVEHPTESDSSLYTLANPMENSLILMDIAMRHIGWELSRQDPWNSVFSQPEIKNLIEEYPKKDHWGYPSHVCTRIGYAASSPL